MNKKFAFPAEEDDDDQLNSALDTGLGNRGIDLSGIGGTKKRAVPQTTKMSNLINTGADLAAYSTQKQGAQQTFTQEEDKA